MKVLITDIAWSSTNIEDEILGRVGATTVLAPAGDEATLCELVRDADALLTCFARVTPAVVEAGSALRVIGRYGVGTDNIAVEVASARAIPVTNVPIYCTDEVAEHVLAMLLCMVRGIHRYDRAVRQGDWSLQTGLPIRRIAGGTLGIIGLGPIGSALARKARSLELKIIAHDRDPDKAAAAGVPWVELNELIGQADYISLHVPLAAATRHLVDARFLARMKPTAYLINASRGGVVDQEALARALRAGEIAGAGLDVFEPEHLPPTHGLLASPRLLATPHTAFYSEQSMDELARRAASEVAAILSDHRPSAVVNPAVLDDPRWSHLLSDG